MDIKVSIIQMSIRTLKFLANMTITIIYKFALVTIGLLFPIVELVVARSMIGFLVSLNCSAATYRNLIKQPGSNMMVWPYYP
jgi:hypothetical protein